MADGFVQVQPNSTGAEIDVNALPYYDGSTRDRERVNVGDDESTGGTGQVFVNGDLLQAILVELRILNQNFAAVHAADRVDDPESLRSDLVMTFGQFD